MKTKIIAAILLSILMLGTLTACGSKKQDPPTGSSSPEETQTPTAPEPPYSEDTTDYAKLSAVPFENLPENAAEDFTVSESAGSLTVTGYTGTNARVRVPETINGKPVTGIGNDAFRNLKILTVLYLPDSVTFFGSNILTGCENLYALHTPLPTEEGKNFIGYLYGAEIYEKNNMPDLRNLNFLEIGGTPEKIVSYALYDCNDLVCLKLPASVKTIGSYALYRCESLKYVNVESLTELEPHALDFCASLEKLVFGSGLNAIGLGALENCSSLHRITLPFIGKNRTENNYLGYIFGAAEPEFSKGFYPSALRYIELLNGIDKIADHAFFECTSLREINLPEGILSIGVRAFSGCSHLETLTLPESLISIRESAFYACSALQTIRFGAGLTTIGIGAFSECTSLQTVDLPQVLTSLPASCFAGCTTLERVTLGGVKTVGKNAFYRCGALTSVQGFGKVDFASGNTTAQAVFHS